MDRRVKTELQHLDGVGGRWEVPRADYTTWHAGGPATSLIRPHHVAGLQRAVQVLNDHTYPLLVPGRGSNLVGSDAGVGAAAISLKQAFERFQVKLKIQSM